MPVNLRALTSLLVGWKTQFRGAFDGREDLALHTRIAMVTQSDTESEIYPWLGQVPRVRKWLGDREIHRLLANEFRITNEDFEATVEVLKNLVDDNKLQGINFAFRDLGLSAAEWRNEIVFDVLSEGATQLGYDGVPLFSAAHPVGDGTQSNIQAGAGEPWWLLDSSRPLKPIILQIRQDANLVRMDAPTDANMFHDKRALYGVDLRGAAAPGLWQLAYQSNAVLDDASFDAAMAAMMARENDKGRSMGVRPDLLVTTPANRAAAMQLLEVDRLANGSSNKNYKAVDLLVTSLVS